MLMRGIVPAENYANLNVCYIGIGSPPYSISMFGEIRNDTLQLCKRCILLLIETVKWLNEL